jgi:hypothetical protein
MEPPNLIYRTVKGRDLRECRTCANAAMRRRRKDKREQEVAKKGAKVAKETKQTKRAEVDPMDFLGDPGAAAAALADEVLGPVEIVEPELPPTPPSEADLDAVAAEQLAADATAADGEIDAEQASTLAAVEPISEEPPAPMIAAARQEIAKAVNGSSVLPRPRARGCIHGFGNPSICPSCRSGS